MPNQIYPNDSVAELAKIEVEKILNKYGFSPKGIKVIKVEDIGITDDNNSDIKVEITVQIDELTIIRTWKKHPPTPIGIDA